MIEEISFKNLDLKEGLMRVLEEIGYIKPTKIQIDSFIPITEGKDVVGMSQTGTGKTAAFALPILQCLKPNQCTQVLVLCPTRELCEQIMEQFRVFTKYIENVRCISVFGGQRIDTQIRILRRGISIIIGTPGRLLDHLGRRTIKLNNLKTLVLDEADEMLKMGFKEDIEQIFHACPKIRQTLLFSATIPNEIREIIESFLIAPVYVEVEKQVRTAQVTQYYLDTRKTTKDQALINFIAQTEISKAIIFSNTKAYSEKINKLLLDNKQNSLSLNGDMTQRDRKKAMDAFRHGTIKFLVATDIAARGIDVNDIDYIINYDFPQNHEQYVHRIGRTARAGKLGISLTLVSTTKQTYALKILQRDLDVNVEQIFLKNENIEISSPKTRSESKNKRPAEQKRHSDEKLSSGEKKRNEFVKKEKKDHIGTKGIDYRGRSRNNKTDNFENNRKPRNIAGRREDSNEKNSFGRSYNSGKKEKFDSEPRQDRDGRKQNYGERKNTNFEKNKRSSSRFDGNARFNRSNNKNNHKQTVSESNRRHDDSRSKGSRNFKEQFERKNNFEENKKLSDVKGNSQEKQEKKKKTKEQAAFERFLKKKK